MTQKTKANVLDKIATNAGISFANTTSFNNDAGSIMTHAQGAMANASKIGQLAEKIAEQQAPSSTSVGPQGGGGFMKTALTTGALAIGMAVAPGVAAVAAVAMSVGEAAHFGLKGNVGKGEMTLANSSAADAFENGVYVSAFDGQTSDIATGKPVASPVAMGQAAPAARGMHNLQAIIGESTAGVDKGQIQDDILAKFREQQQDFGRDMRRLREMGAVSANDPNVAAAENHMAGIGEDIKLAVPKPVKALGMGGMSFGPGMG